MREQDMSLLDDLLQPLRMLGWTTDLDDEGSLRLSHPLQDVVLMADTPEEMRRMLRSGFAADSAFMEALREVPPDRREDLAVVGEVTRVCQAFSSSLRLPSAVVGVMADRGFVDDETYEWFREHAEVVVGWMHG